MAHQPHRDFEHTPARATRNFGKARAAISRREEQSATRVDKFLSASLDLFAERNFASVTIKDIAKALGVNTALIYYYFDSKTDLFRATIEYAVGRAFENVRALDDKSADPADHHRGLALEPRQQICRDPSLRENRPGFQRCA